MIFKLQLCIIVFKKSHNYNHLLNTTMKKLRYSIALFITIIAVGLVLNSCKEEEELPNIYQPVITNVIPEEGPIGTQVAVTGEKFSIVTDQNLVRIGGVNATVLRGSSDTIWVKVPIGAQSGLVTLRIRNDPDLDSTNIAESPMEFRVIGAAISGYNPSQGIAGDEIGIIGSNIAANDPDLSVSFNGIEAKQILNKTDSLVKVIIPTNASTGPVTIEAFGEEITGPDFIILPQITSVKPASAPPGSEIEILGKNFGDDVELTEVFFKAVAGSIVSLNDTLIKVVIPENASEGKIDLTVAVNENSSEPVSFTVSPLNAPVIFEITPNCGLPGDKIQLTGLNFNLAPDDIELTFVGVGEDVNATTISDLTETSLSVIVPDGAASGQINLTVDGINAVGPHYTLIPKIHNFSPKRTWAGSTITIVGENFADIEKNNVSIEIPLRKAEDGFATVEPLEVNSLLNEMLVKIPAESGKGTFKLIINNKEVESVQNFTAIQPVVDSVEPNWAPVGDLITIIGKNFSPNPEEDSVIFTLMNGERLTVAAEMATQTQMKVRVPPGAGEDFFRVKVLDSELGRGPWFRTGITPKSIFMFRRSGINGEGRGLIRTSFVALQPKDGSIGGVEEMLIPFDESGLGSVKKMVMDEVNEKIYLMNNNSIWSCNFDGEELTMLFNDANTPGIKFRAFTGLAIDADNGLLFVTTSGNEKNVENSGVMIKLSLNTMESEIIYSINNGFYTLKDGGDYNVTGITVNNGKMYWAQATNISDVTENQFRLYEVIEGDIDGNSTQVIYSNSEAFEAAGLGQALETAETKDVRYTQEPLSEIAINPTSGEMLIAMIYPTNVGNSGIITENRIYEGNISGSGLNLVIDHPQFNFRNILNFDLDEDQNTIYGILKASQFDSGDTDDRIFRMSTDGSNFEILYLTPKNKLSGTVLVDPR